MQVKLSVKLVQLARGVSPIFLSKLFFNIQFSMRILVVFIILPLLSFGQDYRVPKGEVAEYRNGFAFKFNTARKISDWVGYTITSSSVQGDNTASPAYFKDSIISSCPTPSDYDRYGYSQGALKPQSAARNSSRASKAVNNYVNIAPMDLAFDKGVWRTLENLINGWAVVFDSVHVITGPVFNNETPDMIGENKVNVPNAFFKVVMVYNGIDMASIGFVIPNVSEANSLKKYSMPVDSVELKTGYDFFSELPDYLEFYMEEKIEPGVWKDQSMSYQLKSNFPEKKQCVAALKSNERCTISTTCVTQHCWKHGCDVKSD